MSHLLKDYFTINRARVRKDFWTVYAGSLILEFGFLLRTHPEFSIVLLFRSIFFAIATLLAVGGIVWLFHAVAAWSILFSLAHDEHMSMREYLASSKYQDYGKLKLQRGPGRKLFV